jgi:outer membrane protein assembly factor BamD
MAGTQEIKTSVMQNIVSIRRLTPLIPLLFAVLAVACSDSAQVLKNGTSEERFKQGMSELEDEDYEEAIQIFNTIILQDPASDYADDAQFYLAESYFRDGDYKLAAFNYNRLRTSFPNSQYYKQAFFQSGESYYNSSLSYDRDQRETRYALDVFRSFASIYAVDSLARIAQERIGVLQGKLAQKDLSTAELYMRMEDYKSAILYYTRVIELYPGTDFASRAVTGKATAQTELDKQAAADRIK